MPKKDMPTLNSKIDYRTAMKRRIRVLRKAMGLEQAELGALLGVGQPEISRWENPADKRPKSFDGVREKFIQLGTSLYGLNGVQAKYREVNPHKVPERSSPLLSVLNELRVVPDWFFPAEHTFLSASMLKGEECFLEGGLAYASRAPWAKSLLLTVPTKTFRYSKRVTARVPGKVPVEDVLADMRMHGREFILRLRKEWVTGRQVGRASSPSDVDSWMRNVSNADAQYFSNLILAELETEPDLSFEALNKRERLALSDDLPRVRPREHRLAMELLCRVFELSRLESGALDLAKIETVAKRVVQYREVPTRPFEMLAEMEQLKSEAVAVLDSVLIGTGGED